MQTLSRCLFLAALISLAVLSAAPAMAAERLKVVATFSILGDMVKNVGGDQVALTTLVGADGDAHVYKPTPADAKALAQADLVMVNGLGFEGWIDRLIKASGYKGPVIVASQGIAALKAEEEHAHEDKDHGHKEHGHKDHDHGKKDNDHDHDHAKKEEHHGQGHDHDHGEWDPHAWQNLANGRAYVANIARALAAADPVHADDYRRRAAAYDQKLAALDKGIRERLESVPADRRKVITSHDAFRYFGTAYGMEFLAPVGLSTESEPSAGEVAELIRQMKKENIRALFVENITDPRLIEQLAREAGATIGGTLYSDSLSGTDGPAATYLDMFRSNIGQIMKALTS